MKKIKEYADWMNEEVMSAKCYAEKYVEYKAMGDSSTAGRFSKMAYDELDHAAVIHVITLTEIDKLKNVFQPTQEMLDAWDKDHKCYVDNAAWVRKMLEM